MDSIEPPTNLDYSLGDNVNLITFTWHHVNPPMVDHYEMVLERTDQTGELTVTVYTVEGNRVFFTLPHVLNSPYTATLTAISVCGGRSTAVPRNGMYVIGGLDYHF